MSDSASLHRFSQPLACGWSVALTVTSVAGWGAIDSTAVSATPASAAFASTPQYSLSLALQESLYFYDAEKSGPARTLGEQPLEWRGDSEPSDAKVPLKPIKSLFTDKSGNVVAFNYQVGDVSVDHAYWGPPELQDPKLYPPRAPTTAT